LFINFNYFYSFNYRNKIVLLNELTLIFKLFGVIMTTKCQNNFLSEKSIVFQRLTDENVESVGTLHPIDLPAISIERIRETIGKEIATGNYGTVYKVNDSSPPRVYKIIPQEDFEDGDEIRISKIASDIGVAPTFYSAFLVKELAEETPVNHVVIEMDEAGKSLGKWLEDLAGEEEEIQTKNENTVVEEKPLTAKEKAFKEKLAQIKAEKSKSMRFSVATLRPQKKTIQFEEAIDKFYPRRELFYFELFNRIKTLAEHNIAYCDTHKGNIMLNQDSKKGLQLIDFDEATFKPDTKSAIRTSHGPYNQAHFKNFKQLTPLSEESKNLIQWFTDQLGFFA
jgi:hypothetical protein